MNPKTPIANIGTRGFSIFFWKYGVFLRSHDHARVLRAAMAIIPVILKRKEMKELEPILSSTLLAR